MFDVTKKREEALTRLARKRAQVVAVLETPGGKEMLEALEEMFYHADLFGQTPEETAYNLGRRDVVVYLRQLRNLGKKKEPVDVLD